jgi:hypothetical protein
MTDLILFLVTAGPPASPNTRKQFIDRAIVGGLHEMDKEMDSGRKKRSDNVMHFLE